MSKNSDKKLYSQFYYENGNLIYHVYIMQNDGIIMSHKTIDYKEYTKAFYDYQKHMEAASTVPFDGKFDSIKVA